jgi:membrane fusion protein, multidrug efflux system
MVRTVYVLFILSALLIVSCGQQNTSSQLDIAAPVTVKEVTLGSIEEFITTTGTVDATQSYDIKSETQGDYHLAVNPRTKRPYAVGDEVKKGEAIVTLESPDLQNSVKMESVKLNLDLTQREYEKQKSLYDKGGVTLTELKSAERSLIDAKYSFESAELQLAKLKILVPFDGILTDITYYTPGIKTPSGSAIATVMNYSRLTMDVNLPAKQMGRISEGQPARISNVNLPGKMFSGQIIDVSPALDSSTHTFKATIRVDNPDRTLKPGMFVKVEIVVDHRENVVVIPKDVITARRESKSVFVVERGIAVERRIVTGIENPDNVEVTEGLNEEDRLVIKGFETLRNRAKVKVTE